MSSFGDVSARRAPCPTCLRDQRVTTKFEEINHWDWDDGENSAQGTNEYYVFECNGCETIIFCKSSSSTTDYDYYENVQGKIFHPFTNKYWPAIPRNTVKRLPLIHFQLFQPDLYRVLTETYRAVDTSLPTLAAIGIRTSFDVASVILDIDQTLGFDKKIEKLRKDGFISGKDKKALETLVNAGSAAAHRGWTPSNETLHILVEILNGFIENHLIRPGRIDRIRAQIPSKTVPVSKT